MAVLAGMWGPEDMEFPNGQRAANVGFEIRTEDGFLIPLYGDKNKTIARPNPGFTDEYGNLWFFSNPGTYNLTIAGMTVPVTVNLHPDEVIGGGGGGVGGWEHAVENPAQLIQISHGLSWKPAGVLSIDSLGVQTEHETVRYPAPGIIEVEYGGPFGPGKVYLS